MEAGQAAVMPEWLNADMLREGAFFIVIGVVLTFRMIKAGWLIPGDHVLLREELATLRAEKIALQADKVDLQKRLAECEQSKVASNKNV